MWGAVLGLGISAVLIVVWEVRAGEDSLWRWFRDWIGEKGKKQGDQDKRDKGELPYDYFGKERRDGQDERS